MALGPSLVDFLSGKSLGSSPELRSRILRHCLANSDLPTSCWVAVLDAVAHEKSAEDIVVHAIDLLQTHDEVRKWAGVASVDVSLPLVTRLRLHLALHGDVMIPEVLHSEAVAALLAGQAMPSEVLSLLDVPVLWKHVLKQDVHFAASMLIDYLPASSLQLTAELTTFLQRGLVHSKRANRRACIDVFRAAFGSSQAALLSLLSEQQPLHLLSAVEDPPDEFHDVAARLALRYADTRVQDAILCRLSISDEALLTDLASAASRHVGGGMRCPNWVADWQCKAGVALCRQGLGAVEAFFEKPFPPGGITPLLDTWEQGFDATVATLPRPAMVRALRRHAPAVSARFAEAISSVREGQTFEDDLVLELLLCHTTPDSVKFDCSACVGAAKKCSLKDLLGLARIVPHAVLEALLCSGAAGALRAISVLPEVVVASTTEGFTLELGGAAKTSVHEPISWVAAFEACKADPSLAKNYPVCDPTYDRARHKLIDLGPLAAVHVMATEEEIVLKWSAQELDRREKIEWLHATRRLLKDCSSSFARDGKSTAIAWGNKALKDDILVGAVLALLFAGGGGIESFESVWLAIKSCSVASEAVLLLGTRDVPTALLDKILYSSTLSSALATLHITSATRSLPTLAVLAVRAVAHSGSHISAGHPATQLCAAVPQWTADFCDAMLTQLLSVELPLLQPEGSAKGEPHFRQMRFWLCVGTLMEQCASRAKDVALAAEACLRETMLLPTRVLVQNVWARAARSSPAVLHALTGLLQDPSLSEGFAARCVSVAAQLLLHPEHGQSSTRQVALETSDTFRPLLTSLIGWSASYVQNPRILASLALFHVLERGLIATPGWYLAALHDSVAYGPAFQKLRQHVHMDRWVSDAWESLQHPSMKCPLDVSVSTAQKHVSNEFWTAPDHAVTPDTYQRRPTAVHTSAVQAAGSANLVLVGSFLDNLPNMAGIVRTSEALLGGRAEVTLHSTKVLTDPSFLKMSVAAERAGHITEVPQGPRLIAYIREKRAEGFTVAALEQTSKSEMLCLTTQLPERLILLIGNEQQGLPAWLVQSGLVDIFYELPLLGQTGSLNAHVTAAMVLWHYRLQH